jgi:K+-sensing histidine kinase KdpD
MNSLLGVGVQSWTWLLSIVICGSTISLASAALVTYALLKRRVLDAGFVLSRSIVVAILSLTVVAAFILLEWFLGSVVSDVSHATGVAANAALALVLGLSMRFIHRRVDAFVDAVMFRKRHQNTRALTDFSKEAAFVTDPEVLADLAIEKVRKHTDARSAGLFFRENGRYRAARSFNEVPAAVSENDPAILALKTWHRPLDPHSYDTALTGDLALPIVARGQLLGLLLCGERTGSEVYAPDEINALAQFAQGVGSAFDYFTYDARTTERDDAVLGELRRLRETLESQSRERNI